MELRIGRKSAGGRALGLFQAVDTAWSMVSTRRYNVVPDVVAHALDVVAELQPHRGGFQGGAMPARP